MDSATRWVAFWAAAIASKPHLSDELGRNASVSPEAIQQSEDLRGVFGVEEHEESEEREQKMRRVSGADGHDPGGAHDQDWDELEQSGVFDDEPRAEFVPEVRESGRAGMVVPEEGRTIRTPAPPYVPSVKERREHNATHYPPRSWCRHCVEGRGLASPHCRAEADEPGGIGELLFDYCFLRSKVSGESATTLVGVDRHTQGVLAHVVPSKGTEFQWVAAQLDRDVRKFCYHGRVVVKSDGENSVVDLMRELARRRQLAPTVLERSKAYDSKSNGRVEGAVRRLESQVRTLKIASERNLGVALDVLFRYLHG